MVKYTMFHVHAFQTTVLGNQQPVHKLYKKYYVALTFWISKLNTVELPHYLFYSYSTNNISIKHY